jgi:hypothetical protein
VALFRKGVKQVQSAKRPCKCFIMDTNTSRSNVTARPAPLLSIVSADSDHVRVMQKDGRYVDILVNRMQNECTRMETHRFISDLLMYREITVIHQL